MSLRFLRNTFLTTLIAFSIGCASSKKLTTVLVEDKAGNVELIYSGSQSPEHLVKEIRYYPNSDTLSVTPMKKGAVHGVVSFYHPSNLLKEQTTFVDGVQNGLFRQYDENGVLVFEGKLVNGQKDGVWITWYDEVQMQEQRIYKNDVADGKWTYWYIDGNLKREEVYKLGKIIEEKDYN